MENGACIKKVVEDERCLMKPILLNDLCFTIPNLVPPEACTKLISLYKKYSKYAGIEKSYKYSSYCIERDNYKSLNLSRLSCDPKMGRKKTKELQEGLELAQQYISIMTVNYTVYLKRLISPQFTFREFLDKTFNVRILEYKKGHFIGDHTDAAETIRGSCSLNLNDDYEGGDFSFFSGKMLKTLTKGDGMIFPADAMWIHGTKPITKGTRYAINCFLLP